MKITANAVIFYYAQGIVLAASLPSGHDFKMKKLRMFSAVFLDSCESY